MSNVTFSGVTLPEKVRMWKESQADLFKELSTDRAKMMNYFIENNDILELVDE